MLEATVLFGIFIGSVVLQTLWFDLCIDHVEDPFGFVLGIAPILILVWVSFYIELK
ncbi:hypothetical protein [uncultured Limosilactobacillus sp.]|uniref:hypothetical protein n=1 Tax=uncultured Limosilactobacillus sp. TaxID=2837629 RepID=UPI0025FCE0B6|nr:hypothetical protein [uncultured Limosilactobacillus sp.]